ncbi:DsrE/DsrF/DrsH-like family protein [Nocardioides aquiterrae]|uniref:DsrE/DsrF/DrsH-like family protein n=1 Tax=Nocardioides aquiterrae TaxID=203799 RepID=A0ABN1UHW5_9ACTN
MSDHEDPEVPQRMTIVAWSGDLDKMWPTLILGSTGAAYGMQTTIFFTFWGLFPLVRDDVRITGTNTMTKALAAMNRPGMGHMKLSKLNMAGAGPWMMKKLATEQKVSSPAELIEMCRELDVNLWPCEMTMELLGLRREQLVEGVGEPVGAATALSEMSKSQVNLFI